MKTYEKYKNTEYDWLQKVPNHWQERSIRSVCSLSDERNRDRGDLELLSVYRECGVIRKASRDDNHNTESANLSNYKYVGCDYLVMNKMKMWQGSLGVSKYEGIVSPAYIVCALRDKNIFPTYLNYLLRSAKFKTHYNRISYGIRVGQWDMRYDDFKSLKIYMPEKAEQEQIVRYLDWKVAMADKFVREKRREIALLKELRQAEINRAVTRGLDPTAPTKPSGIDWIGDIPKHWELTRLKNRFRIQNNRANSPTDNYIGLENVEPWTGNKLDTNVIVDGTSNFFQKDNVLFGKLRPYLAKAYLAKEDGTCSTEFLVYEIPADNPQYVRHLFTSLWFVDCVNSSTYGAKMPRANSTFIGNLDIPIPPIEEQQQIVEHIKTIEKNINKAIEKIENEIALTAEYKTRLISDVTTGKVDVRGIQIPDYTIEEEPTVSDNEEIDE